MRSEVQSVLREVEKVIVGKTAVIGKILLVLLAEGHALLDDVPGVGKTTLAVALGRAVDLRCRRVQFTPDVLPSDLTGFSTVDRETGALTEYEPRKMLPVAPAENGFLCFDLNTYDLLLLDPATGGKTKVGLGSGFDWSALTDISGISGLVSGGDGRLFATSLFRPSRDADAISVHGYFVLEGE